MSFFSLCDGLTPLSTTSTIRAHCEQPIDDFYLITHNLVRSRLTKTNRRYVSLYTIHKLYVCSFRPRKGRQNDPKSVREPIRLTRSRLTNYTKGIRRDQRN